MPAAFTLYAALLNQEKWISKTDFIYRVKMHCDSAQEHHSNFLRMLYQMHFSRVKKAQDGKILFQY